MSVLDAKVDSYLCNKIAAKGFKQTMILLILYQYELGLELCQCSVKVCFLHSKLCKSYIGPIHTLA